MDNKSSKLAMKYLQKLNDLRNLKNKNVTKYNDSFDNAINRITLERNTKLAKSGDVAPIRNSAFSDYAMSKHCLIQQKLNSINQLRSKYLNDAKEVLKNDFEQLTDFRYNYLHVQNPEKAFKTMPVWAEAQCDANAIDDELDRKILYTNFGEKNSDILHFPCVLETEKHNFWLNGDHPNLDIEFSHHILRTFLSFIPAGKLKVYVYDEQEMGLRIQPFLDFRNKTDGVIDIRSGADDFRSLLENLDNQVGECIQQKLASGHKDIFSYNRTVVGKSEDIILLLIYDFPGNLDKRSVTHLQKILKNGNKCGFYTVICNRQDMKSGSYDAPDEAMIAQLKEYSKQIVFENNNIWLMPEQYKITIPTVPNRMNDFILEYKKECEQMKYRGLSFEETCAPEEGKWFTSSSAEGIRIPLGMGDGGESEELIVGRQGYHGLIIGGTGSGKSTLLHTMIISAMLHYSPDELQLYLMDFKSGTEFKVYERYRLPHIRLLALDAIQEFGESILEELDKEIRQRAEKFKEVGVSSLKEYRTKSSEPMPRILVLIDEFQVLYDMDQNRKVAENCARLTNNIVKQGRSFGIHLLMSTQSMRFGNLTIGNECFGEMRIRIGLNWADQDTMTLFGRETARELDKLRKLKEGPKGTAVMTEEMGNREEEGFRVSLCRNKENYLEKIAEALSKYNDNRQVFDGQKDYLLLEAFNKYSKPDVVSAFIGEKIKIAPPLLLDLRRGTNQNLLICGQDRKLEHRLTADCLISITKDRKAITRLIDGEYMFGHATEKSVALYEILQKNDNKLKIAGNQGDVIKFIREAYDIMKERRGSDSSEPFVIFIRNIQYIELLRNLLAGESVDESVYLDNDSEPKELSMEDQIAALMSGGTDTLNISENREEKLPAGEMLYKLLRDGGSYGIYFIVTAGDYSTLKDCGTYSDNILKHFKRRILFAISDDDALNLIEGVKISGLMQDTVYYTDGYLDKLQCKPFKEPEKDELLNFLGK